jgi:archaellum component FlaC
MDEREELKREIAELRQSNDQGNAVLQLIAGFNTSLQGQLNKIGIRFQAGADGTPDIFIDTAHLTGFLIERQAA